VSIETLQSVQPALDLSAAASIRPGGDANRSVIEIHAAAGKLDVATAGAPSPGQSPETWTRSGPPFPLPKPDKSPMPPILPELHPETTDCSLKKMKASGHLSQGRVTIPGIDADLVGMDGDVIYEDRHVAFKNVNGNFKGANGLKNWMPQLIGKHNRHCLISLQPSANSRSAATLHAWITAFEDHFRG
jgi:hypothetical protein